MDRNPEQDLKGVLAAFERLRVLDREIPGQLVAAFLYIATHPGCRKTELERDLDITGASGSRLTDWLSKHHRLNKPGLDLIKKRRNALDQRVVELHLTPRGEKLRDEIHQDIFRTN